MNEIDPIHLHQELTATLRRYLLTTLPISDRFPTLRAEAQDENRRVRIRPRRFAELSFSRDCGHGG